MKTLKEICLSASFIEKVSISQSCLITRIRGNNPVSHLNTRGDNAFDIHIYSTYFPFTGLHSRDVRAGHKLGQIATKWDKSGTF